MNSYFMDNIKVTVSDNELEARLEISDGYDLFPSKEDIYKAIRMANITFGIDDSIIEEIVNKKKPVKDITIARGKPPTKGKDAKFVWYVDFKSSNRPMITESGSVNFKQLALLQQVKKGQQLVSKLPPTNGKEGKTVTRKVIFQTGNDLELPAGKNTSITSDGLTLVSEIDGYAYLDSGKVHVDNIYHVRGDVDFSTGNIKFDGKVVIDGEVRSGFEVIATDSIYIAGNVGASNICSKEGDIIVQLGVIGKKKATLEAGRSVLCGFIQDASAVAKRNVIVKHYIINSNITAGNSVVLNRYEGLIRGGKVFVNKRLKAIEIGSEHNIPTEVGIVESEMYEKEIEKWRVEKDIDELKSRFILFNKRIEFLNLLSERLSSLSEEKRIELKNIVKEVRKMEEKLHSLETKRKDIEYSIKHLDLSKSIIVLRKLHRNVSIKIGNEQYFTERDYNGVKICRGEKGILIENLTENRE